MGIENEIETMPLKAPTDGDQFVYVDEPSGTSRLASKYTWGGLATAVVKHTTNLLALGPFTLMPATTDVVTTGTAKRTFRLPFDFTVTDVRASVTTASSSGLPTVDINDAGTTFLTTKLTIDATEKTSVTAAAPPVINPAAHLSDAEITFDVDVAGTGTVGLAVTIIGYRT